MGVPLASYQQGSREILDYAIDWATVLTAESDTASSSVWHVESGSATLGNNSNGAPSPSLSQGKATVWVVGGTIGDKYSLSNVLTTTGGRKFEASILITSIDR